MKNVKRFKVRYLLLLLLAVVLFIIYNRHLTKRFYEEDLLFYESSFKGYLIDFSSSSGGIFITLDDNKEYNFVGTVKEKFPYIAKEGDSIIKPAYADTIVLKKPSGEVYKFTFRKPKSK